MRCSVCSHDRRADIEAERDRGTSLARIAERYDLSENALERHLSKHPRAPKKTDVPKTVRQPARARVAPASPATKAVPRAVAEVDDDDEEAPITSRSPERTTAKSELVAILREVKTLLGDVRSADNFADKASAIRTACTTIRLLANLTGEIGQSESMVASSPHFKRMLDAILGALTGDRFAEARQAVIDALEREQFGNRAEAA